MHEQPLARQLCAFEPPQTLSDPPPPTSATSTLECHGAHDGAFAAAPTLTAAPTLAPTLAATPTLAAHGQCRYRALIEALGTALPEALGTALPEELGTALPEEPGPELAVPTTTLAVQAA
jgi:hypothetical protein